MKYKVLWSDKALNTYENIASYILRKWGKAAMLKFENRVSEVVGLLSYRPATFRKSDLFPEYRKVLVTRHTTLFFEIIDDVVFLLFFRENARNPEDRSMWLYD